MSLKQPISQVRLTNVAVVRLRHGGERFEVACYKNKVLNWREGRSLHPPPQLSAENRRRRIKLQSAPSEAKLPIHVKLNSASPALCLLPAGKETDINEVLQAHAVFHNVSRGELVKKEELLKHFGTDDELACIHMILERGELQVSELERRQHLENLFNDIVSLVVDLTYSAVTQLPLSRAAVSSALKALGFAVRLQQPAKAQALHAALLLQQHNPQQIRRRLMRLKLQLPLPPAAAAAAAAERTPAAAAAALLHFINKDCAGIIETQEPALEVLQQQRQPQQQHEAATTEAAAAAAAAPATEWLLVFLAPPGVYRELEEKALAAGATLSVLDWNCLHDTQQLQQQRQQHEQQQQEQQQQQQQKQQRQQQGSASEEESDASPASTDDTLKCMATSPAKEGSSSSSSSSSIEMCCCCREQCYKDDWKDTTTRAQRKGRGGKGKKQQQQQSPTAAEAAAAAAETAALPATPCPLHEPTCRHQPRRADKAAESSPQKHQQQRKKKQQQHKQRSPPQQQQQQQQFGDLLTRDALDWLSRDAQHVPQKQEQDVSAAAASCDPPQQQQQQQGGVRCRVCNEPLKDVVALRAHCKGRRHAANLQRQANKQPPLSEAEWVELQLDSELLGMEQTRVVRGF
ncbi:hypothetical protein Efla_004732 [Eimeria flavescens]